MPTYKGGRRTLFTGDRKNQDERHGGTDYPASAPYMNSTHEVPSAPSARSPEATQAHKRAPSSRRLRGSHSYSHSYGSSNSRPVSSFHGSVGADGLTSGMDGSSRERPACPDEESDEVLMALEMKTNGLVGCAYFVTATATLYLHEDTHITGFELVESLIFQAQPSSIIVPSRAPESLIDYLSRQSREPRSSRHTGDDDEEHGFFFHTVVSSDFSVDAGKQALSTHANSSICRPRAAFITTAVEDAESYVLRGDSDMQPGADVNKCNMLLQLGTCVNLDNRVTLGCAGALVRELERKATTTTDTDAEHLKIRSIQTVTYQNCMFVTADTLLALQIFHPDLRQGFGRAAGADSKVRTGKDKKSIFDLFNSLAHTSQGRVKLREIFVRPSTDLGVINTRHDAIASLLDPANLDTAVTIRAALKKIRSIRPLLLQLRRGLFLPGNHAAIKQTAWSHLHGFCLNALHILNTAVRALQGGFNVISMALDAVDSEAILRVEESLARNIDFQESRSSGRSVVAKGVSNDLDSLKSRYSNLQSRMGEICENYRRHLPVDSLDEIIGCIFHPQMGYLLVASAALQTRLEDQLRGGAMDGRSGFHAWEEALREDGLVYYKTQELGVVDVEFGDLAGHIIELEADIFHRLASAVLEEEEALLRTSDAIGDIDSIFALAAGAKAFNLSRPRMTSRNVLHIKQGRHLLQELGSGRFVPNDCTVSGGSGTGSGGQDDSHLDVRDILRDSPSTVVVTGPNHSGKSVYLKQAATILFLAHIGSYVPAGEAIVGITDKILTRIATRESVSRDESAFGVDLRQAAFSINFATRRSLILVDEFGKGTATTDGAALLEALLGHFLCLGRDEAPKVLAATHFHEIFDSGDFERHPCLGLCHMSVGIDADASRPEEKVRFLHVLRDGRSTESFGCNCAAMNGVVSSVVERASQITRLLTQGASLEKILRSREGEGDVGGLQEKEDRVRLFLSTMAEALDSASSLKTPRSLLRLAFSETGTGGSDGS